MVKSDMWTFQPIGLIRTPFAEPEGLPIQGALRPDLEGRVELFPEFTDGLKDVEGFSHLILLYMFHKVSGYVLTACPFLDDTPRGVFAIRGPRRPNPVGMTVVRLLRREANVLHIAGIDMVDGSPLLDIKPYIPSVDAHYNVRTGWIGEKMRNKGRTKRADGRFVRPESDQSDEAIDENS